MPTPPIRMMGGVPGPRVRPPPAEITAVANDRGRRPIGQQRRKIDGSAYREPRPVEIRGVLPPIIDPAVIVAVAAVDIRADCGIVIGVDAVAQRERHLRAADGKGRPTISIPATGDDAPAEGQKGYTHHDRDPCPTPHTHPPDTTDNVLWIEHTQSAVTLRRSQKGRKASPCRLMPPGRARHSPGSIRRYFWHLRTANFVVLILTTPIVGLCPPWQ